MYAARRARFLEEIGKGVAVFPSAPVAIRNQDTEHEYRQDSDFYYLTGLDEPESVAILTNQHADHRFVLFVRPRDPAKEVWDGERAGVEGAVAKYGADAAYPISELKSRLGEYLSGVDRLHYRLGRSLDFDPLMIAGIDELRRRSRALVSAPSEIVDPAKTLHEMRLRKSRDEVQILAQASQITGQAHLRAMQRARPGCFEYELEAELLRAFRELGSDRVAYGSIVGSGPNATVLHYRKNNRQVQDGDLVLIDAGAEYQYYASDVTRTFPANGRFSSAQRAIYDIVWEAQAAAIQTVRPNATLDDVHQAAVRCIAKGLVDLNLVEGTAEQVIENGAYKTYFMHRTSHWLGMDVHDVGSYAVSGQSRPLEPGFVLTVEPGIYIAPNAPVEEAFRGIGVRIEDDILVTETGFENLTAQIPSRAQEIEAIVRG